jgi:hypothetical protein
MTTILLDGPGRLCLGDNGGEFKFSVDCATHCPPILTHPRILDGDGFVDEDVEHVLTGGIVAIEDISGDWIGEGDLERVASGGGLAALGVVGSDPSIDCDVCPVTRLSGSVEITLVVRVLTGDEAGLCHAKPLGEPKPPWGECTGECITGTSGACHVTLCAPICNRSTCVRKLSSKLAISWRFSFLKLACSSFSSVISTLPKATLPKLVVGFTSIVSFDGDCASPELLLDFTSTVSCGSGCICPELLLDVPKRFAKAPFEFPKFSPILWRRLSKAAAARSRSSVNCAT